VSDVVHILRTVRTSQIINLEQKETEQAALGGGVDNTEQSVNGAQRGAVLPTGPIPSHPWAQGRLISPLLTLMTLISSHHPGNYNINPHSFFPSMGQEPTTGNNTVVHSSHHSRHPLCASCPELSQPWALSRVTGRTGITGITKV